MLNLHNIAKNCIEVRTLLNIHGHLCLQKHHNKLHTLIIIGSEDQRTKNFVTTVSDRESYSHLFMNRQVSIAHTSTLRTASTELYNSGGGGRFSGAALFIESSKEVEDIIETVGRYFLNNIKFCDTDTAAAEFVEKCKAKKQGNPANFTTIENRS